MATVVLAVMLAAGTTVLAGRVVFEPAPESEPAAPEVAPSRCPGLVAAMPVRDRLAQRLMVGVDPSRSDSASVAVDTDRVGGVFVGGNATTILRGDTLPRLQTGPGGLPRPVAVAVAVDDEGGRVQRIDGLAGSIPSARRMAQTLDATQVRALAAERGRALRARGVTVDLAPVVDVGDQPAGSVIGDRSFGADPEQVTEYAGAFAAGLRDAGVLPVLKHFPGHGRASGDSHRGRVSTPPLEQLREVDLRPYRALLADGSAAVMVGHLDVPGLTDGLPATLSPAAYRLLRDDLGFTGLVVTDDLGAMRAISDRYDLPAAVLAALRAGADVALWTYDPAGNRTGEVLDRLSAAADAGQLPGSDDAVARVLAAKGVC
ncbi:MAG: glycoside hydrolase family 3 N-terminal domain-containing protein [Pseudonocardia sp.]